MHIHAIHRRYSYSERLIVLGLILATWSCVNSSNQEQATDGSTADTPSATFVANPQYVEKQDVPILEIGAKAPDFTLPGVDGKFHSLDDYSSAEVLVLLFTCNHCPTAQAYEERVKNLVSDYQDKSFQLIAISPNSPLGLLYQELGYSDLNDDYKDMISRAEYAKFNFPYLYDGDNEKVSLQYGPVATPHAFVFDKERKLQYQGRLDKEEKPGALQADDLRAAIDAVLAGKVVAVQTTKVFGCSTKWGWKTDYKEKVDKEWSQKAVSLEMADVPEIQEIMKNEGSGKLRLVNVWATWCGPCIVEYPDFVILQRMYGRRDFEFVSISADKPTDQEKALAFLQEKNSAVKNYLFSKDDKYALIEAVDADWNGALPYTVLIDAEGQKIWSQQGQVDFLELKRKIVEHPLIGRIY
ncbi:MAG: redoxin domain-containing protein [Saprospiraceae bacterium]|nr:redoxin domain-containing protein [Saprospiraceae bacterium]